jgi:pyruvate ferredoxin oxidoreductase alpha subunit
MVCLDGFILSHTMERVEIIADSQVVADFVGEYQPQKSLLNPADPVTYGPLDLTDWLFEHKRQEVEGMKNAVGVVSEVSAEYGRLTGRSYPDVERFMMDDAETAVVALGSTAGTAKTAVRELREEGVRAGMLKIRTFRPFPGRVICEALAGCRAVSVMDRSFSFGLEGGPVFNEIRGAAYGAGLSVPMVSHIYGIGGRDINSSMIRGVFGQLAEIASAGRVEGEVERYVGLRE